MKDESTVVVFRKWPNGIILALFPFDDADGQGHCSSFEHVGQHGAADYGGCVAATKPAFPSEYASLKRELEAYPYQYKLIVRKKRPRNGK